MNQTMKKFSKIEKAVSKLAKAIREIGTDNVFDDINIKSSLRLLNGKDAVDCSMYLNSVLMVGPMMPTQPKYPMTSAPPAPQLYPSAAYNNVFKTDRDKAASILDPASPALHEMSKHVTDAIKNMSNQLSANEQKMAYANKFVTMVTSLLPQPGHLEGSMMLMGDLLEALDCEELDRARDLIRQHWVLDKENEEEIADTDEDPGEEDPNPTTGPWSE